MLIQKAGFLFLLFLLVLSVGIAQTDTSYTFNEVEVVASKWRSAPIGSRTEQWDSTALSQNMDRTLADLLAAESGIFVKSYGLGSIATSSIRGASAGHSVILWNGLTIQSPMLGQVDFSLLPTQLMDQVSVDYGGSTALWGSGAIGGVVSLSNQSNFSKHLQVDLSSHSGSFGLLEQQVQFATGNTNFSAKVKLNNHNSTNDFTYSLGPNIPDRQQTNARVRQTNLLQSFAYKPKKNQELGLNFWWLNSNREVPPTSTQNTSTAYQLDEVHRIAAYWNIRQANYSIKSKLAYFQEVMEYYQRVSSAAALSKFSTIIGEVESEIKLNAQQSIFLGFNETYTQTQANGYGNDRPSEYRTALFAAYRPSFGPIKTQLSVRQEWLNTEIAPFVFSLGFQTFVHKNILLKGKINREYRLPTFNDRYWSPGGNENLKAEKGWSQEATLNYIRPIRSSTFSYAATFFNRNIDNWILWSLQEGDFFWSANNLAKVWSRGLEQRLQFSIQKEHWQLKFRSGFDIIHSTNQISIQNPLIDAGDQLIYVPKHKGFVSLELDLQKFRLFYRHAYTGPVEGVSDALAEYDIGDLGFSYAFNKAPFSGRLSLRANNLWNTTYRVIERRPMPGRYYTIAINISFKK